LTRDEVALRTTCYKTSNWRLSK